MKGMSGETEAPAACGEVSEGGLAGECLCCAERASVDRCARERAALVCVAQGAPSAIKDPWGTCTHRLPVCGEERERTYLDNR